MLKLVYVSHIAFMATRSGTPYHPQAQSSAPMDQNLETMLKTLSDQMTRLNLDVGQLTQTNQSVTDQLTQVNARLDRIEPELDTPIPEPLFKPNSRRPNQDPYLEPNPRRPSQDPYFESNPRRPSLDPYLDPNPRRLN